MRQPPPITVDDLPTDRRGIDRRMIRDGRPRWSAENTEWLSAVLTPGDYDVDACAIVAEVQRDGSCVCHRRRPREIGLQRAGREFQAAASFPDRRVGVDRGHGDEKRAGTESADAILAMVIGLRGLDGDGCLGLRRRGLHDDAGIDHRLAELIDDAARERRGAS